MGLVRSNQRAGTVVLPRSDWQWWNLDVLTWVLEDDKNSDFLVHLTEVRLGLEPIAAALAAKRATDHDMAKLKDAFHTTWSNPLAMKRHGQVLIMISMKAFYKLLTTIS